NNSACPILLGFPLYRWRIRVLTLDPMPRAAGDIGEAEPLLISCFRGPPLVSVIDPSVNLILYPLPQPRSSTAGAIFCQGDRCRGKLGQRLHLGSYALALSCRGSSHGCRPDESRGSPDDHAAHCYPMAERALIKVYETVVLGQQGYSILNSANDACRK